MQHAGADVATIADTATEGVSRGTATKYLEALADDGILQRHKVGRNSYYINKALYRILTGEGARAT